MTRTVPSTTYTQPGNLVAAGLWDAGPKALADFLANRPTFRGVQQLITSAASGAWTAIRLDVSNIDTDGGHNTIVNNTRYVCQIPGWYWAKGCIGWNGTSGIPLNRSDVAIAKNGSIWVGASQFLDWGPGSSSLNQGFFNTSALISLAAGDYVEVWGRQGSGSSQWFDQGGSLARAYCDFSLLWLHT